MQNYENEMQGLMNYMGPDYLNMVGGDEPANGLIGYKGIQNPFEKTADSQRLWPLPTVENSTSRL